MGISKNEPAAYLYELVGVGEELVLDCNGEYARKLLEAGYTETPLFPRAAPPAMDREAVVEAAAISLIVDLCGPSASQSATNVRVVEDHLRQFLSTLSADAIRQGEGKTLSHAIKQAKRNLALTQGCMECNAADEQRWQDTITWLEGLA